MSNIEAIAKLNNALNDAKGPLSKKELSRITGTKERTLEAQLKFLKERLGAPLVCASGTSAYKYDLNGCDRFELPGIWFSKDELAALFAIRQVLGEIPDGALSKVADDLWKRLEKVSFESGQLPDNGWTNKVKILPIGGRSVSDQVFRSVVEGVVHGNRLKIVHKKLGAPTRERTVSPLQIVRFRDNWYLDAWCHLENDFRSFAMSRIVVASVLQEKAVRKGAGALKEHFATSYGIFNGKADKVARIRFHGIAAEEVSQERWHSEEKGRFLEDGSYELAIPYFKDTELVMDILRWGDLAEVLEPDELREKVRERLRSAMANY
jgi:proteasome accessory factor C